MAETHRDSDDGAGAGEGSEAPANEPAAAKRWTVDPVALRARARAWLKIQVQPEAFSAGFHVFVLLCMEAVLRPLFMSHIPAQAYEAPTILTALVDMDLEIITVASRTRTADVTHVLFLLVPTTLFVLARRGLRWTDWEHGKSVRVLIILVVAMMAWSGSSFPYNNFLDRGHPWDRLLLIGLGVASWYTPLAVPFFARWVFIMLKEAAVPIQLDAFDFRAPQEQLVVFSVFIWAACISRSFKLKHYLVFALAAWASYYYVAGVAKWEFGPPNSWWLEDKLTNISVGSYVRGWASWFDEPTFMGIVDFLDSSGIGLVMTSFTLVLELSAVVLFFVNRPLARIMFFGNFLLHFGIYTLTGICFWKWMFTNLAFAYWLGKDGKELADSVFRGHKLPLLIGIAGVLFAEAKPRVVFWTTHVAWYDSALTQDYEMWAIGESGAEYLVNPEFISPMEIHFVQGRLCYATHDRQLTGIYGTTGNVRVMRQLERLEKPEDAMAIFNRARRCNNPSRKRIFEDFMRRYFGNLNKNGRQHEWLDWIGRPTHLWAMPKGPLYDMQEKVKSIELRRQIVVRHGGKLHEIDDATVLQLDIPLDGPPPRRRERKRTAK